MATSTASRLAPGTRLRQRYLIRELQHQTPYAITYLALDQERFNRPCILTEFPLQSANDMTQEKLLQRFRQTAMPLFQLNHPQLPQFSAAFRHRQSLFLAQNHAEGVSYRQLLHLRAKHGRALTEPEVLNLLIHVLPVLGELHQRQMVHSKLSPDCILLPIKPPTSLEELHLVLQHEAPLLVGLGVVDQLAQNLATLQEGRKATGIATGYATGQPGYAPPEQLQTGQALPGSDLYALAVTSLVLLTGRDPQELLDGQTLHWNWQAHISLSQPFEAVLQQMLAWQPGDRYPTAQAALEDLRTVFHYISLHSTLPPQESKAFPIAVEQLTVDSLLPKTPSRGQFKSVTAGFAKAQASLRTPAAVGATQSIAQSIPQSTTLPLRPLVSSSSGHPPLAHPNSRHTSPMSPPKTASRPSMPMYPPRSPNYWEMGVVMGLSLSVIAATTILIGAAISPPESLSSGRSSGLQQLIEQLADASTGWSRSVQAQLPQPSNWRQWPEVWAKNWPKPSFRRGEQQPAGPASTDPDPANPPVSLDFDQPMISPQVDPDLQADRAAELQALKAGLEDIPVPIYFSPEEPSQTLSGTLYELRHQSYMLVAEPGQELSVQLDAVDAELMVLDAYRRPLDLAAELTQQWQGELPGGDRYYIKVMGKGEYRLHVQLRQPNPEDAADSITYPDMAEDVTE